MMVLQKHDPVLDFTENLFFWIWDGLLDNLDPLWDFTYKVFYY